MSVRNALLGLLAQRPRHGYELHATFEALVGGEGAWDVKPAQIYTTLARLEEGGLVAESATPTPDKPGPDKRTYTITPAGQAVLADWFAQGVTLEPHRDEFFLKLMLAVSTGQADPRRVIQAQRAALYKALHVVTAQRARLNPRTALAQLLLMDKAVMHLEADLRWLDMVEARLDDITRQPVPEPELRSRGRPKKHAE